MTRFFFDIVRDQARAHDFHGRYLRSLDEARDIAETVCLDMACSDSEDRGSEVQVRDPAGALLFSMKVSAIDMSRV